MLCLVAQLCPTLCDPIHCSPPGSSVHGDSPGKNTGVGCHAFLHLFIPSNSFYFSNNEMFSNVLDVEKLFELVCVCLCVRVHNQGLHCSWLLGELTPHFFQIFIDHSIYRSSFLIWNTQIQKWFQMCSFLNFRETLQWISWMNIIFPESRWLVFPNMDIFIFWNILNIYNMWNNKAHKKCQSRFSTIWVQFWGQMSCKTFPFRAFLDPELRVRASGFILPYLGAHYKPLLVGCRDP